MNMLLKYLAFSCDLAVVYRCVIKRTNVGYLKVSPGARFDLPLSHSLKTFALFLSLSSLCPNA